MKKFIVSVGFIILGVYIAVNIIGTQSDQTTIYGQSKRVQDVSIQHLHDDVEP